MNGYVFFSDQDDVWLENKVSIYFEKVKYENLDSKIPQLYFSDSMLIDESGAVTHNSFIEYQELNTKSVSDGSIIYQNCVQGATILINDALRKKALESFEIVNVDKVAMHDWWLAILACTMGKAIYIQKPAMLYRQHSQNLVGAKKRLRWRQIANDIKGTYNALNIISIQALTYQEYLINTMNSNNIILKATKHCTRYKVIAIKIQMLIIQTKQFLSKKPFGKF